MLNNCSENRHLCLALDLGESIQSFIFKYEVRCGFLWLLLILWLERAAFCYCFVSVLTGICRLLVFLILTGMYEEKGSPRKLTPQFPQIPIFFLLSTFQSLLIVILYNVLNVWLYLVRRTGKRIFSLSSQKWKSRCHFLNGHDQIIPTSISSWHWCLDFLVPCKLKFFLFSGSWTF